MQSTYVNTDILASIAKKETKKRKVVGKDSQSIQKWFLCK